LTVHPRVAGILLAAGEGSRLGRPKALVEIGGQRLADRGVAMLRSGGADPVVVVTGAAHVEPPGALVVHNPDWRSGMGSSLTVALAALCSLPPASCSAAVIALADQPLVGSESVRRLIAAHAGAGGDGSGGGTGGGVNWNGTGGGASGSSVSEGGAVRGGASIAVASYGGRPRNPVLIARQHWDEVLAMAEGDVGARPFLRAHPELVTLVECGDTGRPDDIDTPEDLARVAKAATADPSGMKDPA
jgi:CTP:molybdopterin cytidylyltransferase MocA